MSILKNFAAPLAAVSLALIMGVAALTAPRIALAADPHTVSVALIAGGVTCTEALAKGANTVSGVPADGSLSLVLCAHVEDVATSTDQGGIPIVFTVGLGVVSTGTAKSTIVLSSTAGVASTPYRGGGGIATTDTAIASYASGNAVDTESIALTSPTGNTAAKITISVPTTQAISPATTNVAPGYSSPTIGSNVAMQVQDAAGLGVNSQVVLLTVDKGAIVANPAFATAANTVCSGVTANSITGTTVGTELNAPGGTATAGYLNFAVCADQNDPTGKITVTAQNISTSMANATATLSHSGRPAKIEAKVTGNAIAVNVTDSTGNPVADGTPVRFTMSQNAGAVSTSCTTTTNGAASAVVALVAAAGTVIVSADYNETGTVGTASTCAAAGTQQIAASAGIGASVAPAAGGTGAGGFATAPVYSASKLAQVVFNGGTVAQLETAVTGGNGTGVWAQDSKGVFVLYIVNGGFVNDAFKGAFPTGFAGVTAVTCVGK